MKKFPDVVIVDLPRSFLILTSATGSRCHSGILFRRSEIHLPYSVRLNRGVAMLSVTTAKIDK
jgi:hypothetical protein